MNVLSINTNIKSIKIVCSQFLMSHQQDVYRVFKLRKCTSSFKIEKVTVDTFQWRRKMNAPLGIFEF